MAPRPARPPITPGVVAVFFAGLAVRGLAGLHLHPAAPPLLHRDRSNACRRRVCSSCPGAGLAPASRRRPPTAARLSTTLIPTPLNALPQVVAATTWDVHRNIQLNERPVTPEQQAALEEYLRRWQKDK